MRSAWAGSTGDAVFSVNSKCFGWPVAVAPGTMRGFLRAGFAGGRSEGLPVGLALGVAGWNGCFFAGVFVFLAGWIVCLGNMSDFLDGWYIVLTDWFVFLTM